MSGLAERVHAIVDALAGDAVGDDERLAALARLLAQARGEVDLEFGVGGDEAGNFRQLQSTPAAGAAGSAGKVAAPAVAVRPPGFIPGGGAQPVMLTRLHVRYTANTFPEDLMFTQTRDKQNFQTRYVIQKPYAGSVAACTDTVGKNDCEAMCRLIV